MNNLNVFVIDELGQPVANAKVTLYIDNEEVGWVTSKGVFDSPPGFGIPDSIDTVSIQVDYGDYHDAKKVDTGVRNVTFRRPQAKKPQPSASKIIVLFIHGLGGSDSGTWGSSPSL